MGKERNRASGMVNCLARRASKVVICTGKEHFSSFFNRAQC